MARVAVVLVLVLVAVVVAAVLRRRRRVDAPTRATGWTVPAQLDRADFTRPDAPWLAVVFSSDTCRSCAATIDKVSQLDGSAVATQDVEASADAELHRRYAIDAVPCVVVADDAGVVRASFLGEPSAADLWAVVAELRDPGTTPPGCTEHA